MSPATVTLDLTPDLDPATHPLKQSTTSSSLLPKQNGSTTTTGGRTLLLAPPSVASHEERLRSLFTAFDRSTTDLQMLDRLSAGLVTLPPATYDLVLVLTGSDGALHAEASRLLATRDVFSRLVPALRPGGTLRSEDGGLGAGSGAEAREAVLAGLVASADGFTKPEYAEEEVVPLRLGFKKKNGGAAPAVAAPRSSAGPPNGRVTVNVAGETQTLDMAPPAVKKPAGVGFVVDFSDDLDMDDYDDEDDDELIDEDTLLGLDDLKRPIQQPPECQPKPGQKRRSCKNCTCGLAARLEAEDKARRAKADKELKTLKLASDDLNELDFTVQGKTGSCGSCSLGDAFRCADCPYIGLPPFNPGDKVEILNNVAQF